jgi:hypothetical protein
MTTAMHSARLERAELGEREVTAKLDRTAVERVRDQSDPELVLALAHADGTVGEVAMSWSQEDIDALLASATGDEITIAFDRADLEAALSQDADFEAHGIRRRALVFTVVLATAVTAPTVASAHPAGAAGGGSADAASPAIMVGGAQASIPVSAPGQFNPATTVGAAGVQAGAETYAASFNPATTVGGAVEATVASTPVGTPAVTVGGAIPAAQDATSPASLVGGGGLNTPDPSSPAVMVGGGAPAAPAPIDQTGTAPAVSASSQSFLDQNAAEMAALAGGAAIAITAAGFAAASTSRRRPVRPA